MARAKAPAGAIKQGTTWTNVPLSEQKALVLTSPFAEHNKIKQAMKQPTRERQYNKLYKAYRSVPLRKCGLRTKSGGGIDETKAQKLAMHFLDNQKIY